jgi:hypothetical protein
MAVPPDTLADLRAALVVCVSLRLLSVKFIVPVAVRSADDPVVFAASVKLALPADDVMFGLRFVMVETPSLPMPSCHRRIATLQDEKWSRLLSGSR